MTETEFLRSDQLPGDAAVGYVDEDGLRTNVFHVPVRGSGDGGVYTTAADVSALWTAFSAGKIVSTDWVREMVRPHSDAPEHGGRRYGLGFWLHGTRDIVVLNGSDAGVSFRTVHDPASGLIHTVLSNTSEGAWPMTELLDELFEM
jgi:CubicO group peptidase (beta-lactamase class C family)